MLLEFVTKKAGVRSRIPERSGNILPVCIYINLKLYLQFITNRVQRIIEKERVQKRAKV